MDALKKECKLLETKITLLRDVLVVQEGAAEKCGLQEAVGKVKEGVMPSTPEIVDEKSGVEFGQNRLVPSVCYLYSQ